MGGNADLGQKNTPEQNVTDGKDNGGCFFQKAVVYPGHNDHADNADGCPEKLFFDEMEAVTHFRFGENVTGGGNHDRAVAYEKHNDDQKRTIYAAAHTVNGFFIGRK